MNLLVVLSSRTDVPLLGKEGSHSPRSMPAFMSACLFTGEMLCPLFISRRLVCSILWRVCCLASLKKKQTTTLILHRGEAEGIRQITFVDFDKNWRGNKAFNLVIGKRRGHFINERRI